MITTAGETAPKTVSFDGNTYYAVKRTNGDACKPCAFHDGSSPHRSKNCLAVNCTGVVFLTEIDYITHRLTK